jgi:short-subunit dehydrogenase
MTAYVASKFALVGIRESLRQELRHEREIHVCTILPGATDTPIWKQSANFTGRDIRPARPVHDPRARHDDCIFAKTHSKFGDTR